MDKTNALREGFLVKRVTHLFHMDTICYTYMYFWLTYVSICCQGHLVQNWKARWFTLLPDKLLYYKYEGGKRDSSQRGKILLKDCKITCPFLEYENRPVS